MTVRTSEKRSSRNKYLDRALAGTAMRTSSHGQRAISSSTHSRRTRIPVPASSARSVSVKAASTRGGNMHWPSSSPRSIRCSALTAGISLVTEEVMG